jgi:hypothetical protein
VVKCLCVPLCLCVSGYIRICAFQPSPSESIFSHRQVGTPEAWLCDIMRHLPQDLLDAIRTAGWAVLVLSADRLRQAQLPPSPPPPLSALIPLHLFHLLGPLGRPRPVRPSDRCSGAGSSLSISLSFLS